MNKKITLTKVMTNIFYSTVFIIALYSLGFFTNLFQIRGVDRQLFDTMQQYVRTIFDLSIIGIVLVVIRSAVMSQLKNKHAPIQFWIALIIALGVIGVSVFGLMQMDGYRALYKLVNLEEIKIYYPAYQFNDSIFVIGKVINSITLGISVIFLFFSGIQTIKQNKNKELRK